MTFYRFLERMRITKIYDGIVTRENPYYFFMQQESPFVKLYPEKISVLSVHNFNRQFVAPTSLDTTFFKVPKQFHALCVVEYNKARRSYAQRIVNADSQSAFNTRTFIETHHDGLHLLNDVQVTASEVLYQTPLVELFFEKYYPEMIYFIYLPCSVLPSPFFSNLPSNIRFPLSIKKINGEYYFYISPQSFSIYLEKSPVKIPFFKDSSPPKLTL